MCKLTFSVSDDFNIGTNVFVGWSTDGQIVEVVLLDQANAVQNVRNVVQPPDFGYCKLNVLKLK
jgi:hypothetical protein